MKMETVYLVIGFIVVANGATILTVFTSALKLSNEFGILKEKVETNAKCIGRLDKRIYSLEKKEV
jgi:hypothetical protein